MALDFPANPTNGQTFGSYIYDTSIPGWRNVNSSEGIGLQFKSGMIPVVPTSVTVGAGSATIATNGAITLTNVTNFSLNGVFSSLYRNYKILLDGKTASAVTGGDLRLRSGTTDSTTSDYAWLGYRAINWAGAAGLNGTTGGTTWALWDTYSGGQISAAIVDLMRPFETVETKYVSTGYHYSGSIGTSYYSGHHKLSSSYDGITFVNAAQVQFTGTMQVYGYN